MARLNAKCFRIYDLEIETTKKKRQNGRGSNAEARDLVLVQPTVERIVAWTVIFLLSVVLNPSGSQSSQTVAFD